MFQTLLPESDAEVTQEEKYLPVTRARYVLLFTM